MDILGKVNKVPGGIMVVPMIITALINTFIPAVLKIGGPTTAAFSGAGAMATIGILVSTAIIGCGVWGVADLMGVPISFST